MSVIYFRPTLWNKKGLCGDNASLSVRNVAKATKTVWRTFIEFGIGGLYKNCHVSLSVVEIGSGLSCFNNFCFIFVPCINDD